MEYVITHSIHPGCVIDDFDVLLSRPKYLSIVNGTSPFPLLPNGLVAFPEYYCSNITMDSELFICHKLNNTWVDLQTKFTNYIINRCLVLPG